MVTERYRSHGSHRPGGWAIIGVAVVLALGAVGAASADETPPGGPEQPAVEPDVKSVEAIVNAAVAIEMVPELIWRWPTVW